MSISRHVNKGIHTAVPIALEVLRIIVAGYLASRQTGIVNDLGDAGNVQILGNEFFVVRQVVLCPMQLLFKDLNASEGIGEV